MKYEIGKVYENAGRKIHITKVYAYYYVDASEKKFNWLPEWSWNVKHYPGRLEYTSLREVEEDCTRWLEERKFSDHDLPQCAVPDRLYEYRGRVAKCSRHDNGNWVPVYWRQWDCPDIVMTYPNILDATEFMNNYLITGQLPP